MIVVVGFAMLALAVGHLSAVTTVSLRFRGILRTVSSWLLKRRARTTSYGETSLPVAIVDCRCDRDRLTVTPNWRLHESTVA